MFADPVRLKTSVLAFCEALVWWGTEGSITVAAEAREGMLRLRASRHAAGLTPDGVEALFTPRKPGEGAGSKIGLFVARGVAAAQGGRCWGSAEEGTLTFHLELPTGPDAMHA